MPTFLPWPEIESFHNIRKFIRVDPNEWYLAVEQLSGTSIVEYKAKVKLHGTNAAVQVLNHNWRDSGPSPIPLVVQSRTSIISVEKDNAGFAKWVMYNDEPWWFGSKAMNHIIYGEWCGPGIQKGVAISEIPRKVFAVFAARPLDGSDTLIIEPEELTKLVHGIPDVYVLPWYEHSIDINWRQTDEDLTKAITPINEWVSSVEENDPWVEKTFGVKGTGEGLVFYPTSTPHLGWESFQNLVFKAKGEKHKNIKTAAPAQVSAESAASITAFIELVLTPARLEQGATAVGGFDMKLTGKFLQWCVKDCEKETQDELEASGLSWKDVSKPLSEKARNWYIAEAKIR